MKWRGMVLISGALVAAALGCAGRTQAGGANLAVSSSVEVGSEELTLADLLPSAACPRMRQNASRVSFGKTPRAGRIRVFDGRQVRFLIEALASNISLDAREATGLQVPDRIEVRRAGAAKSCPEIANFLRGTAPSRDAISSRTGREKLECGVLEGISAGAQLELVKTAWNGGLRRWEFLLHCARPEDCVPFMVWTGEGQTHPVGTSTAEASWPTVSETASRDAETRASLNLLVKPGDTAVLTWEQAGIRAVLPVTCLDAGRLGEFVRVRLKNAPRILRAVVVGNRAVQVRL